MCASWSILPLPISLNMIQLNTSLKYSQHRFLTQQELPLWHFCKFLFIILFDRLHPACAPIYNAQAHPENNSRDLKLGYLCSLILYFCFGIFGYLGIWGKEIATTANTVMDYYTTGVPGLIIDFLYIFKVMTSIPVVFYIATVAVFNLFRKNE